MKLIKNNKGVIIFYVLIIVSGLLLKFNNDNIATDTSDNYVTYNDYFN